MTVGDNGNTIKQVLRSRDSFSGSIVNNYIIVIIFIVFFFARNFIDSYVYFIVFRVSPGTFAYNIAFNITFSNITLVHWTWESIAFHLEPVSRDSRHDNYNGTISNNILRISQFSTQSGVAVTLDVCTCTRVWGRVWLAIEMYSARIRSPAVVPNKSCRN